jgi:uncharacterized protein (TIGR03086 family)
MHPEDEGIGRTGRPRRGGTVTAPTTTGPATTESNTTESNTEQAPTDLRPAVHAAQLWVADLLDAVEPDQLSGRTPCTDFDVEALVKHLFGVAGRLAAMGAGRPAESVPPSVAALPTDVVAGYRDRVEQGRAAWADPASLGRLVEAPFGRVPGAVVLGVYLAENLTHGWDLATATGQHPEADPALVAPAYATMRRVLPPEGREGFPFDPPVEPAADAGPTERLANWSGRPSR